MLFFETYSNHNDIICRVNFSTYAEDSDHQLTAFALSLRTCLLFALVLRTFCSGGKMNCVRKNTLVVDFSVLPVRPDVAKVEQFLENAIKLNLADVKCIQLHNTRNCVYIQMKDHDTALQYENTHNIKRVFMCNDKPFKIPVYVDSEAVTVRVCDLPPSMLHATVGEHMMRYGDVISIQNERWKNYFPGIYNGVRVLQMRLKQSIPSFITINNEIATVRHPNQIMTCRWCSKPAHPGQKCLEENASKNISISLTPTTSSSNEHKFSDADFPPINNKQSTEPSTKSVPPRDKRAPVENEPCTKIVPTDQEQQLNSINNDDDDDDDVNDDSSSSPYECGDSTYKRRLSTKRGKEKKKLCAIQGLQGDCDSNTSVNINKKISYSAP